MFGGSDTISSTISFAFYLLHLPENAHYLERACKEADTFHEKHSLEAPDRKALLEELPFLYACIKESGRLYPSVGGTTRHLE